MEIINTDFKKGIVRLRLTDPEDVWYLSQLIETNDILTAKTTRKMKVSTAENAAAVKKTITLTIVVEDTTITDTGTSLRAHGTTKEGTDDIPAGSYHTITLEEGLEFTLQKEQWMEFQKKKLQESAQKKYSYLLCLFDREEALFALTKATGIEPLLTFQGDVPKKNIPQQESKKNFQEEIISQLHQYAERYHPERIILASPAFYKEDLLKRITTPELKSKITLATCSDVSITSCHELLRQPELASILKSSRVREEQKIVDEILLEISKEGKVVYGWKNVQNALDLGAIRVLAVTTDFIQQQRQHQQGQELDNTFKIIESQQGHIHFISSDHDGGKRLNGLSGIAALLRYKIE